MLSMIAKMITSEKRREGVKIQRFNGSVIPFL